MLLTTAEAMHELRISRATLFKLLRDNEIESFLLAPKARRIPRWALREYITRKMADGRPAVQDGEAA